MSRYVVKNQQGFGTGSSYTGGAMNLRRITKTAFPFLIFALFVSCARNTADQAGDFKVSRANPYELAPTGPEIRYVAASEGLVLREGPSVSEKRKTVLPQFTRLTVISRGTSTEYLGEKTGVWLEVEALGQTGWVFGGETIDEPVLEEAFVGEWLEEPEVPGDTEENYTLLYNSIRNVSFYENGSYYEWDPETGTDVKGFWNYNGKELVRDTLGSPTTHYNRVFFKSKNRFFIESEDGKGVWLVRIDAKLREMMDFDRSLSDINAYLSFGAYADEQPAFGFVPFTYALSQGKFQTARYILWDHEVSLSQRDIWGRTPLMYAAASGNSALVSELLDRGAAAADRDVWNRTPLFYAAGARDGDDGIIRKLVEKGADINGRSKAGRTLLMYAVANDNRGAALSLLAAGADRSVKDNDGNTALHLFCLRVRDSSMLGVLEKLVEGADPNVLNNESLTPLDLTMLNRREERTLYKDDIGYRRDYYEADEYGDKVRELLRASGARYSTPEKQREAEPYNLIVAPGTKEIKDEEYAGRSLFTLILPPGLKSIGERAFASNHIKSLIVSGSVTFMGMNAFEGNLITELVLENGLTAIGNRAFSGNPLESVVFSETLKSIEDFAFSYCDLETLVLPDSVTSIGYSAFYSNALRKLTLPRNLEEIPSRAFSLNRLTAVELPPSVKKVAWAAFSHNYLTAVTIGADVEFNERIPDTGGEYTFGNYGASFFRDYNANGKKAGTYTYDGQTEKWNYRR
jgi:ankyrin repeat protein